MKSRCASRGGKEAKSHEQDQTERSARSIAAERAGTTYAHSGRPLDSRKLTLFCVKLTDIEYNQSGEVTEFIGMAEPEPAYTDSSCERKA